jgi:hypothetical protein
VPWIVLPILFLKRIRRSTSLDQHSAEIPADPPLVSIVIPARNESENIEECVRSMLRSSYPSFDITVVDDFSNDDTVEIVSRLAAEDSRVRLIHAPPMPGGWLGAQWPSYNGALSTRGSIICFADADTRHGRELLSRAVNGIEQRNADLFSVACAQVLEDVWVRIVQPQVLMIGGARYGGTEDVTNSDKEEGKLAGGACILVRRAAFDSIGGHEAVKGYIAFDVMLARAFFRHGKRVVLTTAGRHASILMYRSLADLTRGWSKNIILGQRISAGARGVRDAVIVFLLLLIPVFELVPLAALIAGLIERHVTLASWGAAASLALVAFWSAMYRLLGQRTLLAVAYPAGAVILLYIMLMSVLGGKRIRWKGREYVSR